MSDLVRHETHLPDPLSEPPGQALESRPEPSLVTAEVTRSAHDGLERQGRLPGRLAIAVIAASLVAAVAVGAAAFSGGSSASGASSAATSNAVPGPGGARGSLAASASHSASASSVDFSVSATATTPSTTSTVVTGTGAVDLAKGVGQITASVPALASLTGATGSQGSLEIVSDGTNLYVNAPALSPLTGGKSWIETSASSLSSLMGSTSDSLPLSTLTDPSGLLGMLGSLGSPVTTVGPVQLHGESTTEYRTTLSVADIVSNEAQGAAGSGGSGDLGKALQQLGVPEVPVTVWVGSDGLIRQLSVDVALSHASLTGVLGTLASGSGSTGSGATLNLTVGLSHYGQPVSVTVPPASAVTNLSDLGSSLKGMASKLGGTLSALASHV